MSEENKVNEKKDLNSTENVESSTNGNNHNKEKTKRNYKKIGWLVTKVLLIILVIVIAIYFIYTSTVQKKAIFILSENKITSISNESDNSYRLDQDIYFLAAKNSELLDADLVVIEIEYFSNDSFRHYKQISYEAEKNFPNFKAVIPGIYFYQRGKYKIKLSLDGNKLSSKEITVE